MRLGVLFIASQVKGVFIQGVGQYWKLRRLSLGQVAGRAASTGGRAAKPLLGGQGGRLGDQLDPWIHRLPSSNGP